MAVFSILPTISHLNTKFPIKKLNPYQLQVGSRFSHSRSGQKMKNHFWNLAVLVKKYKVTYKNWDMGDAPKNHDGIQTIWYVSYRQLSSKVSIEEGDILF
jgi:hypothetical protein